MNVFFTDTAMVPPRYGLSFFQAETEWLGSIFCLFAADVASRNITFYTTYCVYIILIIGINTIEMSIFLISFGKNRRSLTLKTLIRGAKL